MTRFLRTLPMALILAFAAQPSVLAAPPASNTIRSQEWLNKQVHHKLAMLPWYSVFDNLEYQIRGRDVILMGQVVRPALKSDAEDSVRTIEGVERVENRIEILPPSFNDDRIRRAEYRAIYSQPMLQRYALQAVPSIHIIVKGGRVTLEGVVATATQRDVANIQANGVPDVFSVTNHLVVERGS